MRKSLRWRQRTKLRVPAVEVARVYHVASDTRAFYRQPMHYEDCIDPILGTRAFLGKRPRGGIRKTLKQIHRLCNYIVWEWFPEPLRTQLEEGEFDCFTDGTHNDVLGFQKALSEGRVALKPDEHVVVPVDEVMFLYKTLLEQRRLTLIYTKECDSVRDWFSRFAADETNLACDELLPRWLSQIE